MTSDIIFLIIVAVVIVLRIKQELGKTSSEDQEKREAIRKHIREQIKKAEAEKDKQNSQDATHKDSSKTVIDIAKLQEEMKKIKEQKVAALDSKNATASKKVKQEVEKAMYAAFEKDNEKILNELPEDVRDEMKAAVKYLPNPSIKLFILGAKKAYEMVLMAFKDGNKKVLNSLLTPKIFSEFAKAIEARDEKNQKLELNLVSILAADIVSVRVTKKTIKIGVKFDTEQINFITDKEDESKVVSGSKQDIQRISEIWTFKRDIESKELNWKVVSKIQA